MPRNSPLRPAGDRSLPHKTVDIDLKEFFRQCPQLAWILSGLAVPPDQIYIETQPLVVRELNPDFVVFRNDPVRGSSGLIVENWMDPPDEETLADCFIKTFQARRTYGMPIGLLMVYLRPGDRKTFPDRLEMDLEPPLRTGGYCTKIHLWEMEGEILHGKLGALAGLTLLWKDKVEAAEVREALTIVDGATLGPAERTEALALTFLVSLRWLTAQVVSGIFGGRMTQTERSEAFRAWAAELYQEMPEDLARWCQPFIREKIREEVRNELQNQIRNEVREEERLAALRQTILELGATRFGKPTVRTQRAIVRIQDGEELKRLVLRLVTVGSWKELLT